jgi:peptide/nickel transport system substrate-binding protein
MSDVRWFARAMAAVAVLGLTAGACGSSAEEAVDSGAESASTAPTADQVGQGRLVVGLLGEPDGYLPAKNRFTPATYMVARAVFDPLAAYDADGVARPYLAESITSDEDHLEWEIRLRPDIKFHNGEDLDAQAVKLNLEQATTGILTSGAWRPLDRLELVDDLTLRAVMKTPWAQFPIVLAGQTGFVVAPQMIQENLAKEYWGTGPFFPKDYVAGDHFSGIRNVNYWREDANGVRLPYLGEVEFRFLLDPTTRENALMAGDIDLMHTDSADQVLRFAQSVEAGDEGEVRYLIDDSEGTEYLVLFNTQTGPFADPRLRLAAAHALDRQAMVDALYDGYYEVADGPFSAASPWGTVPNMPGYDPDEAQQLIAEWRDDNGGNQPRVALTVLASTDFLNLAQYVQQAWKDVGFTVDVQSVENAAGTQLLVTGGAQAGIIPFFDGADPDAFYHWWHSSNIAEPGTIGLNFARYGDAELDEALEIGRQSADPQERAAAYAEVWERFGADVPYLWLIHNRWAIAYRSNVEGVGSFTLPDGSPTKPVTWGQVWVAGLWKS